MTTDADIAALAKHAGILPRYVDMQQQVRVTTPETQRALLKAMGFDAANDAEVQDSLAVLHAENKKRRYPEQVIIESGRTTTLDFGAGTDWILRSDEDETEAASGRADEAIVLPALKSDVYELTLRIGTYVQLVRILAAPRRLASVDDLTGTSRLWGINSALYGLRSGRNMGLGDYSDLAELAELAGVHGAAFVGINPIHNMGFYDASISPYSPSHRGFLNTAHIALDAIPGLEASAAALDVLALNASDVTRLRGAKSVPYQEHKTLHNRLLGGLYFVFEKEAPESVQAQFQLFCRSGEQELETFAQYEMLSEVNGSDWREWPTTQVTVSDPVKMKFHMWLQWVADCQLATTVQRSKSGGLSLGLYLDLAVGPRRSGAESWCEQASIAHGVSIGAPPDHLSPEGQNWDLSAFAPQKLQQQNYRPFRRIVGQVMRHAGVVRIDHVLGLNRSFLIPDDGSPGAYIRQPFEALIAIIKIEAERHNCAVIGEDLGLVPKGFREVMQDHGFYGYSVLQYEKDDDGQFQDPSKGRAQALSCFATHDTPTIKGYETGCDISWWQRLGWIDEAKADAAKLSRAKDVSALKEMSGLSGDLASSAHAILARSPATMVSIQLDDILGVTEAQNLPGTIDEHPNWRRKYDTSLEKLGDFDGLKQLSAMMNQTRPTYTEDAFDDVSNG